MKQIDLREGARRQDRAVALLTVLQCWMRGLDGVSFKRSDLKRLLGLERFKETRVDWLKEDFSDFFPHQSVYASSQSQSLGFFFVARREFDVGSSNSIAAMCKHATENGTAMAPFQLWGPTNRKKAAEAFAASAPFFADAANIDERLMASYLALLSQGQISPKRLPGVTEEGV